MSEEAQEASNKNYKKFREHHTRKLSRSKQNEDLIHILLQTSDPFISSIRNQPKSPIYEMDEDMKTLIIYDHYDNVIHDQ